MLDFPRWKQLWLWSITILACLAALPSLLSVGGVSLPEALPSPKINLGLDLAGGSHILLEADPVQVRRQRIGQRQPRVAVKRMQRRQHAIHRGRPALEFPVDHRFAGPAQHVPQRHHRVLPLVAEDEPKTGAYLQQGLSEAGFSVDRVVDGNDADEVYRTAVKYMNRARKGGGGAASLIARYMAFDSKPMLGASCETVYRPITF